MDGNSSNDNNNKGSSNITSNGCSVTKIQKVKNNDNGFSNNKKKR